MRSVAVRRRARGILREYVTILVMWPLALVFAALSVAVHSDSVLASFSAVAAITLFICPLVVIGGWRLKLVRSGEAPPVAERRFVGQMTWHAGKRWHLPWGTNGPLAEVGVGSDGLRFGPRRHLPMGSWCFPTLHTSFDNVSSLSYSRRHFPGARRLEFRFRNTPARIAFECSRADAAAIEEELAARGIMLANGSRSS